MAQRALSPKSRFGVRGSGFGVQGFGFRVRKVVPEPQDMFHKRYQGCIRASIGFYKGFIQVVRACHRLLSVL